MRLSGPQYKQLLEALISAFPTPDELQSMVMFGLNENLHAIASGGDLRSTIFDLIRWAEARGHTESLIKGALGEQPSNPALRKFATSVGIEVPPAEEPGSETPKPSTPRNLTYENFDLLIDRGERGYRARVLSSPVGQASNEFELPFTEAQLKGLFGLAGRTTRGLRLSGSDNEAPQLDARTFGEQLYTAVFRGNLETALIRSMDASERLRIRIILDEQVPELADLPWEYLYSPHLRRFVGLSEKTVLVRYLQVSIGDQPVAASTPLTMLAVISDPTGVVQLNVEKEYEQLKIALKKPTDDGTIRLERLKQPTIWALQDRLRQGDVHLIHYIGHGFFNEQINQGGLVLEDRIGAAQEVTALQLGTVLNDHSALRLLFLNACEGARGGRDDAFTGTAQYLVSQGVPAVVAMQFEVTDPAAITLAEEFYEALADLYPVDAAVTAARKALSFEPVVANRPPEWGTPVLFMRSDDGRLFGKPATGNRPATANPQSSSDSGNSSSAQDTIQPPENQSKQVFISYAWGGESEAIVEQLEAAFQANGIDIVRDKNTINYKDMIRDFMRRIGQGNAIIIIISKKYLESENCMFELLEIAKHGEFTDRIFPIVMSDAEIYNPITRIRYIRYWEDKIKELDEAIRSVSAANLQGFRESIDLYTEIRSTFSTLTDTLADMNALTPEMHRDSEFSALIDAISMKLK